MSRKKLTLSVEERLTRRAKTIAKERGTSVSRLVETFFTALSEEDDTPQGEQAQRQEGGTTFEAQGDFSPSGYAPSEWARRWRGAFAEEGTTYPEDPAWEEKVLEEEIEKKHNP
ncbi:MAG: DUF6364 family protein [Salinibacter sp.]|uniref:DUF6364 family protein n=1 Tax=Salinibacter sp. TaxID=2065818 RepID=UPI002FC345FD